MDCYLFFLWKSILAIALKKVEQLARSIRLVMIAFSKWHVLDDPIDLNAVSVFFDLSFQSFFVH